MIKSWSDKEARKVFELEVSAKIPDDIQQAALRKLRYLDAGEDLRDLSAPPSNRLEALKGKRRGQYSIRVNDQWRICFQWSDGNARDVEIVDYH